MMARGIHPADQHIDCPECNAPARAAKWEQKRTLPQIGQTYDCRSCGREVYVYDAADTGHEELLRFRPVTDGMAMNLLFYAEVGDWPDSELEGLFRRGLERAEAIDYYIVEQIGLSQTEWAERTDRAQPSISENISKAKQTIDSE